MLFLTLDCGRQVSLTAFCYGRTYGGLLEGRPDDEYNARIIQNALDKQTGWGQRKTHLIPPIVDRRDPEHPVLPGVLLHAWLVCFDPVNPAFHGSELVVVWFTDECHDEAIQDIVHRAVSGLPWEQLADDFYW